MRRRGRVVSPRAGFTVMPSLGAGMTAGASAPVQYATLLIRFSSYGALSSSSLLYSSLATVPLLTATLGG